MTLDRCWMGETIASEIVVAVGRDERGDRVVMTRNALSSDFGIRGRARRIWTVRLGITDDWSCAPVGPGTAAGGFCWKDGKDAEEKAWELFRRCVVRCYAH